MSDIRGTVRSMIQKGQDPKDYLIEVCRPQCTSLQQKLQRCETALKNMTHADPELSCMYPLRDWVTCVDSCVGLLIVRCNPRSMPNSSEIKVDSSHDSSLNNYHLHIQPTSSQTYLANSIIIPVPAI